MKNQILLIACIVQQLLFLSFATAQSYQITVDDVTANLNDEFIVGINTSEVLTSDNIISYQFTIKYDATSVKYNGYDSIGTVAENCMFVINDNVAGELSLAFALLPPAHVTGSGSLINLKFVGLVVGTSPIEISDFIYNTTAITNTTNGSATIVYKKEVTIPDITSKVDSSFEISLNIAELLAIDKISAYQLNINYDPSIIEYTGYSLVGTIPENNGIFAINPATPGLLRIACAGVVPFVGEGSILKLQFNSISCGSTSLEMSDFLFNTTPISELNNGNVTVDFDVTITASDANINVGDNFTNTISSTFIPSACGASSFSINLSYDNTKIEYTGYNLTGTIDPGATVSINSDTMGTLIINQTSSAPISGSGELVDLEFTSIDAGTSSIKINQFKYDDKLFTDFVDGQITSTLVFGNVDNVTGITNSDASLVLQNSVGLSTDNSGVASPWETWRTTAADVDNNDILSSMDASLIMQFVVGIISEFPAENIAKNTLADAEVEAVLDANSLVFYANGTVLGFDILSVAGSGAANLGTPEQFVNSSLNAYSISEQYYKIALALAEPTQGRTELFRIPLNLISGEFNFNTLVNGQSKTISWSSQSTGISQINMPIALKIYPNPTKNLLKIDFELPSAAFVSFRILDNTGRVVKNVLTNKFPKGAHYHEIDLKEVQSGIYFIEYCIGSKRITSLFTKE
ncbi:MAG: cohesin domain-containing protein [Bacteroidales bacterium]|nr:cohesin domain-containing protein [Bacteroidales bacterium]